MAYGGIGGDVPELPEVETTRRGLTRLLRERAITAVRIRERRLRLPIPRELPRLLIGQRLLTIERRAKYLLFKFSPGVLLIHLGMSGTLRVLSRDSPLHKHDHLEVDFDDAKIMRLRDPRRFGLALWTTDPLHHPLLAMLGPEPWDAGCTGAYLHARARGRRVAIKNYIMNGTTIVGVGNIYASEALHRAGIHPARAAGKVSAQRYDCLLTEIRAVLDEAIAYGGTTLRDFTRDDGKPGYFRNHLRVYGRAHELCACGRATIKQSVIGQRSSYYCPACQH